MAEISRFWHKLLLILLKYLPFSIALCYLICAIFSTFGIDILILPGLIYISPISGILILAMSKALQFCSWHRLPIYYCFYVDTLSTIDYKWNIPLSNINVIILHLTVLVIFILLGMYLKENYNRNKRKRHD